MTAKKTLPHLLGLGACAALLLCAGAVAGDRDADGVHHGNPFTFGLWGDMPYAKNGDEPKIPALIASMNAEPLAFTVFDGDTKDGSSLCTDDAISTALTPCAHPPSTWWATMSGPTATAPTTAPTTPSNDSPSSAPRCSTAS